MTLSFLDLPYELRLQIYEDLYKPENSLEEPL